MLLSQKGTQQEQQLLQESLERYPFREESLKLLLDMDLLQD